MPTAAKLIAALALAAAAYGVAGVAEFRSEYLQQTGINPSWIAFVAALVGWSQLGPMASKSYKHAIGGGVASAFVACAFVVFAAACLYVANAVQYHAFKDVETMVDAFIVKSMLYTAQIGDWSVLVAMVFGGALAGVFSGFAGRLTT